MNSAASAQISHPETSPRVLHHFGLGACAEVLLSSPQVTIVTSHMEAVGVEGGDACCQGDMEKADMVDGEWAVSHSPRTHLRLVSEFMSVQCLNDLQPEMI